MGRVTATRSSMTDSISARVPVQRYDTGARVSVEPPHATDRRMGRLRDSE